MIIPVLGQAPPASFSHVVSDGGTSYTADFVLHTPRGPNFSVEVQQADGSLMTHTAAASRTYIGTIAALPGAMASAVRRESGDILYHVLFEDGAEWINDGTTTSLRTSTPVFSYPDYVVPAGGAGSVVYAAEVGVDLPNSQYVVDGDVDAALEMIEHSVNTVNLIYLRDASILHRLGRIVVRADATQDPYAGMTSTGPLLTEINNQWNNVLPASTHDIGLVATSATGGGLAWVGVVGGPGYSSNGSSSEGDFSIVWRHEVGHNWSMGHFDGGAPEGATINSGNSLSKMSGPEQAKVIAHRTARLSHLDVLGGYSFPIPPKASMDAFEVLPQSGSTTVDVLLNDHDANGDVISIGSFQAVSDLGGTVVLSVGTGPGGRDELTYTPPADLGGSTDSFTYRVQDTGGLESEGRVMVRLRLESDILAYFSMDDGSGGVARDSSSYARHGELQNDPAWRTGKYGGGLAFDGVDDRVIGGTPNHATDELTISAWVKRDGDQTGFTGLVFMRGGTTTAGLNFGNANELRYHWNDQHWGFNSGLVVPDGVWTFVAMVIEPTRATFYMDDGTGLQSAVNNATHVVEALDAPINVGRDSSGGSRHFLGEMDQVLVQCRALTNVEIASLAGGLDPAADAKPEHFSEYGLPGGDFSWTPGVTATSHRVYFSTDYNAVKNGLAAADQGVVTEAKWSGTTSANGAYYWRVDSSDGTNVVEGPVWQVTIVDEELWARWKMDELGGSVLEDASGNGRVANFAGDPQRVAGAMYGGIDLDGDDSASSGVANHATDRLTITGWVKRSGDQAGFSGLVFARGGTTTAGMNFGNANELRYHWNDQHWGFDSGLVVPDGVWTFVAMVIEPTRATFYMDDGTGLQSAVNNATHVVEAFDTGITLGKDPGNNARHMVGQLDDVRVYCRSLSRCEIVALDTLCPDTFSQWSIANGGVGKSDDGDGDLLAAFSEYALGSDPADGASGLELTPTVKVDGYEFSLPFYAPCDVTYVLQTSVDLVSWSTVATKVGHGAWVPESGTTHTLLDDGVSGGRSQWSVNPPAGDFHFYRLRFNE